MIDLRERFTGYILKLAKYAAKTSEPIVRYMEYEFPGQGFETVTDCFMLGGKYLTVPVTAKGQREVKIRFPDGKWTDIQTGESYMGGREYVVAADLSRLPIFEKNRKIANKRRNEHELFKIR
jgi:alpha-glucosidase